jgi:transcriptional regulator with XRE-family HTH domain
MDGKRLRLARKRKGLTQKQLAVKLRVSQPYLALMERGDRRVPADLARRVTRVLQLPPTALPLESGPSDRRCSSNEVAGWLGALGYRGFAYLKGAVRNPAEAVVAALRCHQLDSRVVEGLPWLLAEYPDLDWHWLAKMARAEDLQNRLGFVASLARALAYKRGDEAATAALDAALASLQPARLAREDTLCQASLSRAEGRWLRQNRSAEARHWNLLSDLTLEQVCSA